MKRAYSQGVNPPQSPRVTFNRNPKLNNHKSDFLGIFENACD